MADRLAALVQQHYEKFLPQALAAIPAGKRAAFFADLADQMNQQIGDLEDDLAGEPAPGETFQQTLGRLTEARQTAESQVIREMLPDPEASAIEAAQTPAQEEQGSADPEPMDPGTDELRAAVAAFWDAREATDSEETVATP